MKQGRPFVAFSLEPSDDALHITLLAGPRVLRNEVVEDTFTDLPSLSLHGLEGGAAIIGKFVHAVLQLEFPEKFEKYPSLIIEVKGGPAEEELNAMEKRLRQDGSGKGSVVAR